MRKGLGRVGQEGSARLADLVGGREQALVQRLSVELRNVLLHLVRNVPVQPLRAALLDLQGEQGGECRVTRRVGVGVRVG